LVRPIAEHDALYELTHAHAVNTQARSMVLTCAEDFRRMLEARPVEPARLKAVMASAAVWWDVLEQMPDAAVWVAANRTIPEEIIRHLSAHASIQVRTAIASNPEMGDDVMIALAHDKSDLVRMRVACNAQTSRAVLADLVADPCVVVSKHAQARLQHDINGVTLPSSYLDEVSMFDLLH